MVDYTEWTNSMMSMARQSFEMGKKNMEMFHNQVKEAAELTINNTNKMQDAARKNYEMWNENMDKARKNYVSIVEEGFSYIEQQYPNTKTKTK